MSLNLLVIGDGSRALADRFNEVGGTRVRCAAVNDDVYEDDLFCLKSAARIATCSLQGRVDAVVLTCDVHSERSRNMVFSMTEMFKTNRDRVFVYLTNCTVESLLAASSSESSWEMQSALVFFADRFLSSVETPSNTLKSLLKRKLRGANIQMNILSSDDFIRGAMLRRDARKQLFSEASQDAFAKKALERRFQTKMAETLKTFMSATGGVIH